MLLNHVFRRVWRPFIIAAVCLAIGAFFVIPHQATAAKSVAAANSTPKPTIVLVHGAWADASSWSGVIKRLQRAGYTVTAPPNLLRGIANDAGYLHSYLQTITGPIILVGHSYGGAVITNAAVGIPNVKALVYIDAFIPDQGETILQLVSAQPGSCLGSSDPTKVFDFVPVPGAPAGDADVYLKAAADLPYPGAAQCFANDLPASEAAVIVATQRPLLGSANYEPSGAPAWKTIPSWSLIGAADHVIPPAEQRFMSQRAQAHIVTINASHVSLISHPEAVTDIIMSAAVATK